MLGAPGLPDAWLAGRLLLSQWLRDAELLLRSGPRLGLPADSPWHRSLCGPGRRCRRAAGTPRYVENFEIIVTKVDTFSFRSHFGKHLTADAQGMVRVDSEEARAREKFSRSRNEDGAVSLLSFFGKHISAEKGGAFIARMSP